MLNRVSSWQLHSYFVNRYYFNALKRKKILLLSSRAESTYTPTEEESFIQKQEEGEIKLHKNLQECIRTSSNKGAAATEAQRMLNDFVDLRRQTSTIPLQFRSLLHKHSFRIVLDAWLSIISEEEYSSYRAELKAEYLLASYIADLLHHQQLQTEKMNPHVDGVQLLKSCRNMDMFSRVLSGWSKSSCTVAPQRVNEILYWMEDQEVRQRQRQWEPRFVIGQVDATCYNIAITAWATSDYPWRSHTSHELLRRMEERHNKYNFTRCKPDMITYCSVIDACSLSGRDARNDNTYQRIALDTAISVWEELQIASIEAGGTGRLRLTHVAYGSFLRACCALKADDNTIEKAFSSACANGQVSKFVLQQFKKASSDSLSSKFCLADYQRYSDLPNDWTLYVNNSQYKSRNFR